MTKGAARNRLDFVEAKISAKCYKVGSFYHLEINIFVMQTTQIMVTWVQLHTT